MEIPKIEDLNCSNCTERSMFLHYFEFWRYLDENYPKELKWTEKLYRYYNNITKNPTCPICGKEVKFIGLKDGYRGYCSVRCMGQSDEIKEKKKLTSQKHYGVDNPMHSETVKDKLKQNNIEKFGVDNPFKLDSVKEKIKETNLKRYGAEYPQQSKEIYEKSKQTNLKKYGAEYHSQNSDIKKKKIKTSLEKYGVENHLQSEEVKEKIRQTCIKHYGVDNYNKTQEYHNMMQERMPEIRKKMTETCIEKYGVDCYNKTNEFKQRLYDKKEEILRKQYQTKKENGTFNTSEIEKSFTNWLTENEISFETQYRSDKYPFNCDFYFPEKDLYLEIQGSWTHNDHPYDPESQNDKNELILWRQKADEGSVFYENAIETWTQRDPLKRETAKKNGLNWIEVFSCDLDDVIKAYNES